MCEFACTIMCDKAHVFVYRDQETISSAFYFCLRQAVFRVDSGHDSCEAENYFYLSFHTIDVFCCCCSV